ncbi:hypothetical protein LCGC14_0462240 [marine sediment metagenome]|uniref:Uncharacterized protein n=1 Tax=marine sediment metagenome TaxID=412755 RepID=A0A0F9SES5_9ZZZZ
MTSKSLLKILFLTLIITGAFTFLISMSYYNKNIMFLALVQMMDGSLGYYILEKFPQPQKLPHSLKSKKT